MGSVGVTEGSSRASGLKLNLVLGIAGGGMESMSLSPGCAGLSRLKWMDPNYSWFWLVVVFLISFLVTLSKNCSFEKRKSQVVNIAVTFENTANLSPRAHSLFKQHTGATSSVPELCLKQGMWLPMWVISRKSYRAPWAALFHLFILGFSSANTLFDKS